MSETNVRWTHILQAAVALLFIVIFGSASYAQVQLFSDRIDYGVIDSNQIYEASGIDASGMTPGVLWTHNDSGDEARVFAIGTGGELYAEYLLEGVSARDWEDIAVGPGPEEGISYLYVGEIGDNSAVYPNKYIYRFPEPVVDTSVTSQKEIITGVKTITLVFPEHARDAETLMVDPVTRDIYIVSKREDAVNVYRAPYPQALNDNIVLEHVVTLPYTMTVGGDISPDGREILIKTYDTVYCWFRSSGESIGDALSRSPVTLPYVTEPQGEAICWDSEGRGYYTLSEQRGDDPVHLYYYERTAR